MNRVSFYTGSLLGLENRKFVYFAKPQEQNEAKTHGGGKAGETKELERKEARLRFVDEHVRKLTVGDLPIPVEHAINKLPPKVQKLRDALRGARLYDINELIGLVTDRINPKEMTKRVGELRYKAYDKALEIAASTNTHEMGILGSMSGLQDLEFSVISTTNPALNVGKTRDKMISPSSNWDQASSIKSKEGIDDLQRTKQECVTWAKAAAKRNRTVTDVIERLPSQDLKSTLKNMKLSDFYDYDDLVKLVVGDLKPQERCDLALLERCQAYEKALEKAKTPDDIEDFRRVLIAETYGFIGAMEAIFNQAVSSEDEAHDLYQEASKLFLAERKQTSEPDAFKKALDRFLPKQ